MSAANLSHRALVFTAPRLAAKPVKSVYDLPNPAVAAMPYADMISHLEVRNGECLNRAEANDAVCSLVSHFYGAHLHFSSLS